MNPVTSARASGSAELARPVDHPDAARGGNAFNIAGDAWRAQVTALLQMPGLDEYDGDAVLSGCEQWLERVSGPELDLRCGDDPGFADFLSLPDCGLIEVLAREAERRSGAPICSALLQGSVCAEAGIGCLAGLHNLKTFSIEGPFAQEPMKLNCDGLPEALEHIALSGFLNEPVTIELPPGKNVEVTTSGLHGPGVLGSCVVHAHDDEGARTVTHMTGMVDGPVPADVEERIVTEHLKGPNADLGTLSDHDTWVMQSASPQRWAAWIEKARALGGAPVESMHFGGKFVLDAALAEGLKQFSSLTQLTLDASLAGRPGRVQSVNVNVLDLGALQGTGEFGEAMRLQSVRLVGDITGPVLLMLPPGVAHGTHGGTDGPSFVHKSWIGRVDVNGRVMEEIGYHSLDGQVHLSRARLFEEPAGQRSEHAQSTARDHNINMMFELDFQTSRGLQSKDVNCALLSTLFLKLDTEAQEAGQPMPWSAFLGEEELAQAATLQLHGDLMRLYQSGSCALFEAAEFGVELHKAFAGMAPGEFRRFALGTPAHLMGLVLHVKQRHDGLAWKNQYVAKLYDPNGSASTLNGQAGSLTEFDRLSLDNWLNYTDDLFEGCEHRFATLFAWPPTANAVVPPPSVTASPEARASGEFLYAVMEDGHAELMEQCIADLARLAATQPPGFLQQALRAQRSDDPDGGLEVAIFNPRYEWGRPELAARYCRAVLNLPGELLDRPSKIELLNLGRRPILVQALNNGGVNAVAPIAAEILASSSLALADKVELLVPRAGLTNLFSSLAGHNAFLVERLDAAGRFAEYLTFVLGLPALPLEIKLQLLGAENWAHSEPGMVGHHTYPAAAALVLAAIADCQAPEADKASMRAKLAFNFDEEQALSQLKGVIDAGLGDDEHRAALNGLLTRMEASG